MRAHLTDTQQGANRRRALLLAALLLTALTVAAAAWQGSAPAKTPQEKLQATRDKLEGVRADQSELAETIAAQNRAIDSMIGEVSALRQKQAALEAELGEEEARLDAATKALEDERAHLERVRKKLQRSMGVLRDRLVAIYEAGSPDIVNAILESEDFAEMSAQTEYLNRIQAYDEAVVKRVKTLRDEVTSAVAQLSKHRAEVKEARDAVAAMEQEAAAARAEAEARFAELKSAQAQRRQALNALESREEALSNNLASISEQIAAEGASASPAARPPRCRRRSTPANAPR